MNYSQKYVLVYLVSPLRDGAEFHMADWPLHITLADVFAVDRHASGIDKKMNVLAVKTQAVTVAVEGDVVLGSTPVVLLANTAPLQQLHNSIIATLEESGAVFNNPEFTKDGFLPHSTIQRDGQLLTGSTVSINSISLIDMFPDEDWQRRRVLATFRFSGSR